MKRKASTDFRTYSLNPICQRQYQRCDRSNKHQMSQNL